jgi:hypothetical protein
MIVSSIPAIYREEEGPRRPVNSSQGKRHQTHPSNHKKEGHPASTAQEISDGPFWIQQKTALIDSKKQSTSLEIGIL